MRECFRRALKQEAHLQLDWKKSGAFKASFRVKGAVPSLRCNDQGRNMHDVLGGIRANCSGTGHSAELFKNPDCLDATRHQRISINIQRMAHPMLRNARIVL
jgi:hypothetical protein